MNFTKTKTLHNVKLVDGKLVFDKEFFRVGRELVTTLYESTHSRSRMCTVVNCTDTLLTIMLAGDSAHTELTIDQYIKRTVFWVLYKKADTKENILNELVRSDAVARRLVDSEVSCGFVALGEKCEIKSNATSKFTSYVTEKPFIFIDHDDKAYTLNSVDDDGQNISILAMDYSESPDDYEEYYEEGDFDSITIYDRTRPVTANDFMDKFKRLVVFDAKTMTVEEDDLHKCITACEGYDHELIKKIPTEKVVAFKSDSSIYSPIYELFDVSLLKDYCPHKTPVSEIDYVLTAEYTNVSVTFDDIFNSID